MNDVPFLVPYRKSEKRIGITIKSRTRTAGTEKDSVNIFKKRNNDREKVLQACKDFACEPWIAIYVEASDSADLFLTTLDNYDAKYRGNTDKAVEDWKMGENYCQQYARDPSVRHLRLKVESENWKW